MAAEPEKFKKPKTVFTKGVARSILLCKGAPDIGWLEREIEQLCRENCWPLNQLLHNDFMTRLGTLLETRHALIILESLRRRYAAAHPFTEKIDDDLDFVASKLTSE